MRAERVISHLLHRYLCIDPLQQLTGSRYRTGITPNQMRIVDKNVTGRIDIKAINLIIHKPFSLTGTFIVNSARIVRTFQ